MIAQLERLTNPNAHFNGSKQRGGRNRRRRRRRQRRRGAASSDIDRDSDGEAVAGRLSDDEFADFDVPPPALNDVPSFTASHSLAPATLFQSPSSSVLSSSAAEQTSAAAAAKATAISVHLPEFAVRPPSLLVFVSSTSGARVERLRRQLHHLWTRGGWRERAMARFGLEGAILDACAQDAPTPGESTPQFLLDSFDMLELCEHHVVLVAPGGASVVLGDATASYHHNAAALNGPSGVRGLDLPGATSAATAAAAAAADTAAAAAAAASGPSSSATTRSASKPRRQQRRRAAASPRTEAIALRFDENNDAGISSPGRRPCSTPPRSAFSKLERSESEELRDLIASVLPGAKPASKPHPPAQRTSRLLLTVHTGGGGGGNAGQASRVASAPGLGPRQTLSLKAAPRTPRDHKTSAAGGTPSPHGDSTLLAAHRHAQTARAARRLARRHARNVTLASLCGHAWLRRAALLERTPCELEVVWASWVSAEPPLAWTLASEDAATKPVTPRSKSRRRGGGGGAGESHPSLRPTTPRAASHLNPATPSSVSRGTTYLPSPARASRREEQRPWRQRPRNPLGLDATSRLPPPPAPHNLPPTPHMPLLRLERAPRAEYPLRRCLRMAGITPRPDGSAHAVMRGLWEEFNRAQSAA
jgi:hypothetical protein